ncbi:M24 family metallopeptidase [Haladaptatus pallidirubidus]|uniref:Xaa-Pro dipeptidase n=1 Tax=Haladaptatus pallidirubidus TaxID=1008152 RepID=A0AAV3UGN4_9EURY|nr:Xaa-Pro peptidase family protein [Haladaptatus pallidirubidus]
MREQTPNPRSRFVDDDRLDRIRRVISERDVDGLLALSPANSYYLSGAYAGMYSRPVAALVTDTQSIFVGPYLELQKAQRTAWVDRLLVYEDADDPFEVIATAISETAIETVGTDYRIARPHWPDSVAKNTDCSFLDETEQFQQLRAVKTDWELDMIRRASDLASAGMEAYLESVRAEKPELRVVNEIQDAYYETYLDLYPEYDIGTANELGQYGFSSVLTGEHALEPHSISAARQIEDGESVVGIALPSIQGYICEEERTVLTGDVTEKIEAAMETLVTVREDAIDQIGPGESVADIDSMTADVLRDAGYGSNLIHRTGHGEGITIHEGPALNAREAGDLQPGMVISIEPGLYFEDEGAALRHSDTFVITKNGTERLTRSQADVIRRA